MTTHTESLLGRFGLAAPTPGLDPILPRRFDLTGVLALSVYEIANAQVLAEPIRSAVRSLSHGHPDGEFALFQDGAYRLVHAIVFNTWPSSVLFSLATVLLVATFLASPLVASLTIGRLSYVEVSSQTRARFSALLPLAARHYHRVAGIYVFQFLVQAGLIAVSVPIGGALGGLALNDRTVTLTLFGSVAVALVLASLVAFLSDLVRAALVADEVAISRAFEIAARLCREKWARLLAAWGARLALGLGFLAPILALPFLAPSALSLFIFGQIALAFRAALWVGSLAIMVRMLRASHR